MKINNNRDCDMNKDNYFAEAMPTNNMPYMDMCCNRPMEMMGETMPGVVCPPVYECPQETVCHRYICHEVPHIMPCNTRIINHHIYRHTYTPTYSCCEENEVQNVYERKCC
ncbi:MAG: hypothetical protein NC483_07345 [Ruminococcus sp.]|nr:hypothetical protein [Ruminococcus sp.]